ncbi:MAG: conjugal transfer protein TraF [Nitrospirae bacterium]|nr:conjugal transfer protein TraF [Nitrospirota bacterium]
MNTLAKLLVPLRSVLSTLVILSGAIISPGLAGAWIDFLPCKINFFSRDCVKPSSNDKVPPTQLPKNKTLAPAPRDTEEEEPGRPPQAPGAVGPTEQEVQLFLAAPTEQKASEIAAKLRETMTRVNYGSALLAQALAAEWASMGYTIPGALPLPAQPSPQNASPQNASFQFPAPDRPTILYFSREGCPFCAQQEPILAEILKISHGHIQVIGVAPSTGYPKRALPFPFIPGDSLFESAKITTTPTMIFLSPHSSEPTQLRGLSSRDAILGRLREVAPDLPHWIR